MDDKKMPGALKRLARMKAGKKNSKMGKAYNKMEKSKDFKPLPFLDGPKRKDVKGGPSDVESYMKKGGKTKTTKNPAFFETMKTNRKKSNTTKTTKNPAFFETMKTNKKKGNK
jgi:hypothetical protein